jgi:CPA2 family monovalent cation:H+ antiporter-2
VVIAVDKAEVALQVVKEARRINPHVPILVRTRDDSQSPELKAAGASEVVPELLVQPDARLPCPDHAGFPERQVLDRIAQVRHDRYRLLHGFYPGAEDEEL